MFTEELRGNANKKKQEQARARRRKLKELQLKKQKEQNEQKKSGNQSFPSKNLDNVKVDSTEVSVVETMSSSSDAVTKALEQRKVRSLQKLHNRSALIIQSVFRSYVHVQKLKQNERTTLVRRLSDLKTLTDILKNQEKPTYIPPTSLAISMLNQVFFLTHTTPRYQHMTTNDVNNQAGNSSKPLVYFSKVKHLDAEDIAILSQILEIVLLPGIIGDDIHLDTTMLWLESKEGKLKMKKLLRLICNSLLSQKNPNSRVEGFTATGNEVSAIDQFLRILIGISSPQPQNKKVVPYCKELLLSQKYDLTILQPGGNNIGAHPIQEDCLDLIHMLRSLILYPQQKVCIVIPQNAEEARENCILKADKERADIVFRLVLDGVIRYKIPILTSRFFSEIISIPLLSWRIEGTTVNLLLRKDSSCEEDGSKFSYLLDTFLIQFSQALSPGSLPDSLSKVLPVTDVPMKLCPASSILCLFANIVQFGILCPSLNGTNPINDGTKYFNFLARLVDLIPIGTFCSRQSSVEWISDGSKLTPVVLSPVILDQCKLIFLDSFVRNVFHYAIDTTGVQVDKVINNKDKRDEKLENDFKQIFSESLASVAAKEAMIDRSKGFLKSKWAKTLSKKITSIFSNEDNKIKKKSKSNGKGALMNTSQVSRDLAKGSVATTTTSKDHNFQTSSCANIDVNLFFALTHLYSIILSRWGGSGSENIIKRQPSTTSVLSKQATSKPETCVLSILNVMCFSTQYVKTAWSLIQSNKSISDELQSITDTKKCRTPIRALEMGGVLNNENKRGQALLLVFVACLYHMLIVTDDVELHDMDTPLPLHQIRRCIILLKNLLYRACCIDDTIYNDGKIYHTNHFGVSIIALSSKLMRDLHDRSSRRPLCAPKLWLFDNLLEDDIRRAKSFDGYCAVLDTPVLQVCPFLVSFKRRLKLFERIVSSNREMNQGRNDGFSARPGVSVNIMRGRVLEDGLLHLNKLGRQLRQRIIVQYLNQAGAREAGLDAGGLFKEFWTDLCDLSFNVNYALFCETENGFMYPNPSSRAAHGEDSIVLFEFLGRILGKALYEGITIKPQFAHFFLSFLRGYNFFHMLPDVSTIDKTLYNNLMFLKTYEGNAEDLCLSFTIANDDFGTNEEIELIPNGANIDVTDTNKHRYIGLVAKHRVCDRVKDQSEAFTRGLLDVIDRSWLRIFNEPELQVLISGASDGKIDVEDMKANSRYTGGYTIFDRQIHRFWNIVSSFDRKHQADLLRFVTSCERPPPLGFASLNPPFTIQRVSIMSDIDKLPTASTCFNILKLPTYSNEKVMKERLLYAIQSGAGFELT